MIFPRAAREPVHNNRYGFFAIKMLNTYDLDISVKYLATTQIEFGGN
jgi:hypothetical protein